jgi:hypothetical protein
MQPKNTNFMNTRDIINPMNHEGPMATSSEQPPEPDFEIINRGEKIHYKFDNFVVSIDRSGKNYQTLPELSFARLVDDPNKGASLDQPQTTDEQTVSMTEVVPGIIQVMQHQNLSDVWFYPYGDDANFDGVESYIDRETRKQQRSQQRLRLFRMAFARASQPMTITPDENQHGYILSLQ